MEFNRIEPFYQPEPVFTPLVDERLDEARLDEQLSEWFREIDRPHVFAGGALITGLAAQAANAPLLVRQIRQRLENAIVAVGHDPRLESWLAFMSNCSQLSRLHPDTTFINLDIGGGTTNIAVGRRGEVLRTGCYFIGARHIEVEPGGYRIRRLSAYARRLLDHLQIRKRVADVLAPGEVAAIVDWNLDLLQAIVTDGNPPQNPVALACQQVPLEMPESTGERAITLSGGVGQLVYRHLETGAWPATTAFGDLGIDLARRIVASPFWEAHLKRFVPTALGRATVYGLLRHSTQVSGSTVYLPDPECLPLSDLLLLGVLTPASSDADIDRLISLRWGLDRAAASVSHGMLIPVRRCASWPSGSARPSLDNPRREEFHWSSSCGRIWERCLANI